MKKYNIIMNIFYKIRRWIRHRKRAKKGLYCGPRSIAMNNRPESDMDRCDKCDRQYRCGYKNAEIVCYYNVPRCKLK